MSIITNEILIPKKIFSSKVDKDLDFDSSLPDFCPDIARIVKVDCTPFSESCTISDGKAILKGKVVYDILYETDYKNRLRCCNFTQEFSHSVPIPKTSLINLQAFAESDCERIGCKLLSPRRLIVKATLGTKFDIEGDCPTKAVAVTESDDIFFRKKTIGFDGRTAIFTNNYKFTEQLALSQSEKAIGEIVCGSVNLRSPQVTFFPGRAEIKTTATIHTLCEEENADGKYFASTKSMPINIDFSNEAIAEHKNISFKLIPNNCTFSAELDQYGESRVIKNEFSITLCMKINDQFAYTVADDLFEKEYDSTPVRINTSLPHLYSQTETAFTLESKLEPLTPKPENLLDAAARSCTPKVEATEEGAKISGTFIVTTLCETAEGIQSFDNTIPYEKEITFEQPTKNLSPTAEVAIDEVIATLHSDGSATIRIIATAKIFLFAESEESFISEVTKRVATKISENGEALIYCFPTKDEDLWNIAKIYRADPESIKSANPSYFDDNGLPLDYSKPILVKA